MLAFPLSSSFLFSEISRTISKRSGKYEVRRIEWFSAMIIKHSMHTLTTLICESLMCSTTFLTIISRSEDLVEDLSSSRIFMKDFSRMFQDYIGNTGKSTFSKSSSSWISLDD